ncbi:MAG: response regulator, partial [Anaerotignaceae bacterium]
MDKKVLVVDDEKNIVDIIKFNLKKEGYEVITATNGEEAVIKVYSEEPDLILLDIMMPIMDGYEACKKIREKFETPIIMLTARAEEVDKVLGLELGADDYVTKPFGVRELMARVKANLRRKAPVERVLEAPTSKGITFGKLVIDEDLYEVKRDGEVVDLTYREFELLKFLATEKNQ